MTLIEELNQHIHQFYATYNERCEFMEVHPDLEEHLLKELSKGNITFSGGGLMFGSTRIVPSVTEHKQLLLLSGKSHRRMKFFCVHTIFDDRWLPKKAGEKACECGAEKTGQPQHSTWCCLFGMALIKAGV